MIEQGYSLSAWTIKKERDERRIVIKLIKKTTRGEKFYAVHAPQKIGVPLSKMEFTEPILLKAGK